MLYYYVYYKQEGLGQSGLHETLSTNTSNKNKTSSISKEQRNINKKRERGQTKSKFIMEEVNNNKKNTVEINNKIEKKTKTKINFLGVEKSLKILKNGDVIINFTEIKFLKITMSNSLYAKLDNKDE